jgi:dihydropteroate synthase
MIRVSVPPDLTRASATAQIQTMTAASHPAPVSEAGGHPPGTDTDAVARLLALRRPVVMGILNVTPDSFSDGGAFFSPDAAITQARRMATDGADIIDIGAESTRPYGNAAAIAADEELRRLATVVPAVVRLGFPVSIDTMKATVAEWAIGQGASIVNDVWGLQRDPDMARIVARHRVFAVIMHNREAADPLIDILDDMDVFFERSLAIAARAGIRREAIMLDPGIGFGKTPEQSMTAIARLDRLKKFNLPLLVGASRKRFIDAVAPAPPERRLGGSIAAHVLAVLNGAKLIRAHDVAETVQAMRILAAIGARS